MRKQIEMIGIYFSVFYIIRDIIFLWYFYKTIKMYIINKGDKVNLSKAKLSSYKSYPLSHRPHTNESGSICLTSLLPCF